MNLASLHPPVEKPSLIHTIQRYVEMYLKEKAGEFKVDKKELTACIMVTNAGISYDLILGGKFHQKFSLTDVIGMMAFVFKGKQTEKAINDGFTQYAVEKNLNRDSLKLKLFYDESAKITYQVHYHDEPQTVDLIEFFTKK